MRRSEARRPAELSGVNLTQFLSSLILSDHPMKDEKEKAKAQYFFALEHIISLHAPSNKFASDRLAQYRGLLIGDASAPVHKNRDEIVKTLVKNSLIPWRRNRRFILMCDTALISMEDEVIIKTYEMFKKYAGRKNMEIVGTLIKILRSDAPIPPVFVKVSDMIRQYRENCRFSEKKGLRVMVTANMSAGKSTLINALIGKPIAKTSLEACTAKLCFYHNKPFEDDAIHMLPPFKLNASRKEVESISIGKVKVVASYFRPFVQNDTRFCLIDTPGVNSKINPDHGTIAKNAIFNEKYDKLLYVLNINYLLEEHELKHLKWLHTHVPGEKIIFVINKLDCCKQEDSISASINDTITELKKIGFERPIVCPLSAYFALLLKRKKYGETLSKKEETTMQRYIEDFSEPEYDLSIHYSKNESSEAHDDLFTKMSRICGLDGLEKIIYGRDYP